MIETVNLRAKGLPTIGRARNMGKNGAGRNWATPPEVFDPLNAEFNFTLDPCCSETTAKCPTFFAEGVDNGLERDWSGHRVFMNPPYGREIYAWTKKARTEAERGVLVVGLLPASTDLAWWHDDVLGHAEVRYIRGRVSFITDAVLSPTRHRRAGRNSSFSPSVIAIWRAGCGCSKGPR